MGNKLRQPDIFLGLAPDTLTHRLILVEPGE
jgi:hypothetical protein